MAYPLILAYNGDEFARINYDGSWSVMWDKVVHVRFQTPTIRSQAIISCAEILLAARDNFFLTPWAESDAVGDRWTHKTRIYDIMDIDPPDDTLGRFGGKVDPVAKINLNGTWAIKWKQVEEIARQPLDDWKTIAIIGFCRLLMAAQYRFHTVPWDHVESDEDE